MRLLSSSVVESPDTPKRARLVGEVSYDSGPLRSETYWFDVPESLAPDLSGSGNPWLVCLAPLAATLGEPLEISLPVDAVLADSVGDVLLIWSQWHAGLRVVPIAVERREEAKPATRGLTAAFFSGGMDSFFTVLRHESGQPASSLPIDELICILGFDISLEEPDALRRLRDSLGQAASALEKPLVDVRTNLRRTRFAEADWGLVSHGCALAGVGLALENRYEALLIPQSDYPRDLRPWGSHPVTDPLLSTRRTRVVPDGIAFDRLAKTELVARSAVARRYLRVCYRRGEDANCGNCAKCYRTMLSLELFDALEEWESFPHSRLDLSRVRRIYAQAYTERRYLVEIRSLAAARGRRDIVRALDRCFRRSALLSVFLRVADWIGQRRGVWRIGQRMLRAAYQRSLY